MAAGFAGSFCLSVERVLSICEDILCQQLDVMSAADKEILHGVLGRYAAMKRQIEAQETQADRRPKKQKTQER